MSFDVNVEVTTTDLAAIFGLTARRIQQLAQDGIFKAHKRGKYILSESVQAYSDYCGREKAISPVEMTKLNADVSIKKARAIKATLEAKELQGKMHRSEDVSYFFKELIYAIRGMIIALPGRLAVDTANASDPNETSAIIKEECNRLMEELVNYRYDSKKYEDFVRKRLNWELNADEDDSENDE